MNRVNPKVPELSYIESKPTCHFAFGRLGMFPFLTCLSRLVGTVEYVHGLNDHELAHSVTSSTNGRFKADKPYLLVLGSSRLWSLLFAHQGVILDVALPPRMCSHRSCSNQVVLPPTELCLDQFGKGVTQCAARVASSLFILA